MDSGATGDGEGNRVEYRYDNLGRMIEEIKQLRSGGTGSGNVTDTLSTGYEYDDNSRLIRVSDAIGNVTQYAYDGELSRKMCLMI